MTNALIAPLGPEVYKLLQHPVRHQILIRTGERPWSPIELSDALDLPLKRICEQVDILAKAPAPLLELVEERPGPRGRIVHYYRAISRVTVSEEDWRRLSRLEQADQTATITREVLGDWLAALDSGTFYEDPEHALMRTALPVDREGMREIADIIIGAQARIAEVGRKSAERRAHSGEAAIRLITCLAAFRAAP